MNDEITPHLKVVQHPNPKRRTFHVIREVGDIDHMYGFGKESHLFSGIRDKNPGEEAKALGKRLGTLPGVTDGHMKQYEISVGIGDAFSWKDVGPLVLGEIIRSIYPEVDGETLDISVSIGWGYHVRSSNGFGFMDDEDNGYRTRYQDTVDHEPIAVNLGSGRPRFDIEHLLNSKALDGAKEKAARETIIE